MITEFILRSRTRAPEYWKLNTSILEYKTFKDTTQNFWNDWQNQKANSDSITTWWEIGKLYFKMLVTHCCVQMQRNVRNKQTELT